MAILRGGKRIGGIDVRIGLPRDRSLDNVTGDPRLKRTQGGNPETTLGRFQSYVNEAEGFARKARYYAEFQLPKGLPNVLGNINNPLGDFNYEAESTAAEETAGAFPSQTDLLAVQQANGRRVQAFCSSISMPDREMVQKEIRHGNKPARKVVYDFKSDNISATFYADKFMRERSYFELWQKAALSTSTSYNVNYYDNYVTNVNIFQLGQYASRQERDDVTYGVQLIDAFPVSIGAVDYSADANTIQTISVDFSFRYWINYFIDQSGKIELGSPTGRVPEIKNNRGIFGGILNKLPPELRRAGRDVLNDLRRRVPLGRVTGGRVFPPFKLPPLNI
jgi:hypothetical protein